ncbi:hypothetical protein POM88_048224 [Heracleum sosnowskyi]|uniref:Uncharacterized protein n=1 Tax=Heracleum sosnowskyi TaxID=360622 RepID=A0AAD8GUW5_9APIA|nr:hypothetical protein POM88_048224 [Heracleum sosnowskyi]
MNDGERAPAFIFEQNLYSISIRPLNSEQVSKVVLFKASTKPSFNRPLNSEHKVVLLRLAQSLSSPKARSFSLNFLLSSESSFSITYCTTRKMFPKEEHEDGLLDAHYAYRVRDRLRKQVRVPLRNQLYACVSFFLSLFIVNSVDHKSRRPCHFYLSDLYNAHFKTNYKLI